MTDLNTAIKKVIGCMSTKFPYRVQRMAYQIWMRVTPEGRASSAGDRLVVRSWEEISTAGNLPYTLEAYRYFWVGPKVKGKKVLDLGCGSGYGSYYLSLHASSVLGIDKDLEAIEWAKKCFHHPNLEFLVGDALNLQLASKFDVIVCVEVLEHLEEEDQTKLIERIHSLCSEKAYITTPNVDALRIQELKLVGCLGACKVHKKELAITEFKDLLSKFFPNCLLYGEHVRGVSTLKEWMDVRKRKLSLSDMEMISDIAERDDVTLNSCSAIMAECEKCSLEKT